MPEERKLSVFERYLTLWVFLCMIVGSLLGRWLPSIPVALDKLSYAQVNLPIAVCLFFMIYPIMVKIDFAKGLLLDTEIVRGEVTPLFRSYISGCILLGIAPCTAMVLVWGFLARGNDAHTLVMTAINSLTMLVLFAPLGGWLLKENEMPVPWITIILSVFIYVGLPLVAGYFSRKQILQRKGEQWLKEKFLHILSPISIVALLATLIVLFTLKGEILLTKPLHVVLIAIPLFIQTCLIFVITYVLAKVMNLTYEDAAPSAMIGASNHFEVAIATAVMLFGLSSGAALATVVGVLIEVPVMLMLVGVCKKTRNLFRSASSGEMSY
jgi:ACR3 family arsenite transporter